MPMVTRKPHCYAVPGVTWAAALMLVAGVGIIVAISAFGVVPGILTLLGALFAFMHFRHERHIIPTDTAPAH
jgi:hypothetical protein